MAKVKLHQPISSHTSDDESSENANAFANSFLSDDSDVPATPPAHEEAEEADTPPEEAEVEEEVPPAHKKKVHAAHKAVKKAVHHAVKHAKDAPASEDSEDSEDLHPTVFESADEAESTDEDEEAAPAASDLLHPMAAHKAHKHKKTVAPKKAHKTDLLHPSVFEESSDAVEAPKETVKKTAVKKAVVKKTEKKATILSIANVHDEETPDVDESTIMDEPDSFADVDDDEDTAAPPAGLSGLAHKYLKADDSESLQAKKAADEKEATAAADAARRAELKKRAIMMAGGHDVELDLSGDVPVDEEDEIPEVNSDLLGMSDDDDDGF